MIQVTKLTARSFSLDYLDVFWEIGMVAGPPIEAGESVPHEIYSYDFYVLRSEAALGPYEVVGGPLRDTYLFRDPQVHLLHKWREHYYKIRVVKRDTDEEAFFGPAAATSPEHDLIASEIVRQEDMLFREFIGRRCILYPARTFGPRCSCFDVYSGRKTRSGHLPCFGTGWLGGFMAPVEVFAQIDPYSKIPQATPLGEVQNDTTAGRMISFPPVSPRDILVESENRRWRVNEVKSTQRLRAVVRQELTLHEIPRGDIEYALPVKVDVRSLRPSAERNFTNPQNLADDDFSDILAVYGHSRGTLR